MAAPLNPVGIGLACNISLPRIDCNRTNADGSLEPKPLTMTLAHVLR